MNFKVPISGFGGSGMQIFGQQILAKVEDTSDIAGFELTSHDDRVSKSIKTCPRLDNLSVLNEPYNGFEVHSTLLYISSCECEVKAQFRLSSYAMLFNPRPFMISSISCALKLEQLIFFDMYPDVSESSSNGSSYDTKKKSLSMFLYTESS